MAGGSRTVNGPSETIQSDIKHTDIFKPPCFSQICSNCFLLYSSFNIKLIFLAFFIEFLPK